MRVVHLPAEGRRHTLCGRPWTDVLLGEGTSTPICAPCWEQMNGGPVPKHEREWIETDPAFVPADDETHTMIRATAQRLDAPKELE